MNRKFLTFRLTVLTSSLTMIRFLPGFWKNALLSLFLPSPTSSICLSPQFSSMPSDQRNMSVPPSFFLPPLIPLTTLSILFTNLSS